MKIKFEHVFGGMGKGWLQVSSITAEVATEEEQEALATGWLMDDGIWYQTRSVRLNCKEYQGRKPWPKNYTFEVVPPSEEIIEEMQKVYNAYIAHKKYDADKEPWNRKDRDSMNYGIVRNPENRLVAFTAFHVYNEGIESTLFCWDYSEPKISLGIAIQDKEIEHVKSTGLKYLYIGGGYESFCKYKSSYKGFEYWTGSEWSADSEMYKSLCDRDSELLLKNDMSQLVKVL